MTEKSMRILHITVVRQAFSGLRTQICAEVSASQSIEDVKWDSLCFHTGKVVEDFEREIPFLFKPLLLRNLYGWIMILRLCDKYDYVLVRHMTFDIFSPFFSIFVSNRISVHHAMEIAELRLIRRGIKGRIASLAESIVGNFCINKGAAILGVTMEIAEYEKARCKSEKTIGVYPNGINFVESSECSDLRATNETHAFFIASEFSIWHGLEKFCTAIELAETPELDSTLKIHLVGELFKDQEDRIRNNPVLQNIFVIHGTLNKEQFSQILPICDIGIGSFNLQSKGLTEASTLKVRELLASGLPVYSGHKDASLPDDFPYYIQQEEVDLSYMMHLGEKWKRVSRAKVREAASQYVTKEAAMRRAIGTIRKL